MGSVLVRLNDIARFMANADHGAMQERRIARAFLDLERSLIRMEIRRENLRQNQAAKANEEQSIAPFV